MKVLAFIAAGFMALVLALGGIFVVNWFSYGKQGAQYEARLDAEWNKSQNSLSTYTTKVQEVAQVPDMYKNDLKEIVEATFQGRYGQNGSQAVFQFIKEQNLSLDPQLYRQVQQVMESGRNDFQASQNAVIDIKRSYQTQLNSPWSGFWFKFAGYPKVDLNKYKVVVLNDVRQKFETGEDSVIKLR